MPNDVSATGHYHAYLRQPVKRQPGLDEPVIFQSGGPRAFYVNIEGGCHNQCDCSGWGAFARNRLSTLFTLGTGVLLDKMFGGAGRGMGLGALGGGWGSRFGSYNVGNFNIDMSNPGLYTYEAPPKAAEKPKETPAAGNGTPADDNGTPADNNGTPADNNGTPADNNGTPADGKVNPIDNNGNGNDNESVTINSDNLKNALNGGTAIATNTTHTSNEPIQGKAAITEAGDTSTQNYPKAFTVTDTTHGNNVYKYTFEKFDSSNQPVYKLDVANSSISSGSLDTNVTSKEYTITEIKKTGTSYTISMQTVNDSTLHF